MKNRPKLSDDAVRDAVVEALLESVMQWREIEICGDAEEKEEVVADLKKALGWDYDGYQIAKNLDGRGWDPDAALVDILDNAGGAARKAHGDLCRAWVAAEKREGPAVGAAVVVQNKAGVVVRNEPDGRSLVRVPELGHVAEGRGCHGVFVPWEELQSAPV